MTFLYIYPFQPTMEPLKLSGVQCSDRIRHAGCFADSVRVDCSDSEVVGVSFKQPRHWVFTNLYWVIIALGPVFSSNLTSTKLRSKETRKGEQKKCVQETSRKHKEKHILCLASDLEFVWF